MALAAKYWISLVVLIVIGLYFVIWHTDPLPLNHEAIGLGDNHVVHAVVGIVLWVGAVWVGLRARRAARAA